MIAEMGQADQGSTRQIELERQRNAAQASMIHLNSVHQMAKAEFGILERNEEINHAQNIRDRQEAEYLAISFISSGLKQHSICNARR